MRFRKLDKFKFVCVNCGKSYNKVTYLCPDCEKEESLPPKGVLKICYDYHRIKKSYSELKLENFLPLLPIKKLSSLPKLRVGNTPLYKVDKLKNRTKLPFKLFIKDDGQNPTYSYKDRASAMVCAYAKENGLNKIVAASTGNAGSSLAGICASTGQTAIIMVPKTAPLAKLTQILMYGAKLITVDGNYDMAFDFSIKASKKYGWYNRNTAYNPITVEGKKTVSFELFGQLEKKIPDKIFVSVGDGCIISGLYKGFEDLMKIGIIKKMPTIIGVQSEKSANTINNLKNSTFLVVPATTLADSISVDIPRNFYMTKQFIQKYNGQMVTVSDEKILVASKTVAESTGIFSEPAAACAMAGLLKYYEKGQIGENESCVVLLTGCGLKDLKSVQKIIFMPKAIKPNLEYLKSF